MADVQQVIDWSPSSDGGGSLGRNLHHDEQSRQYAFRAELIPTILSVTHNRVSPVLDQDAQISYRGQVYNGTGSCTGNASTGNLGTHPFIDAAPDNQLTLDETFALDIYAGATNLDGFGAPWPTNDRGSSGLAVAKVCTAHGWITGYQHCFSLNAMLAALQVTPVIVGTNWYDSMDQPGASNGVVTISPNAQIRGGHEYEVIGVDVDRKLIHCVNSWGTGWAENGHFFMSYDTMTRLLGEQGDCTVFVPVSQPAPTPTPPQPTPTPTPTPTPPQPQPTPTPTPTPPAPTPTPDDVDKAMWLAVKKFFGELENWAKGKGWD